MKYILYATICSMSPEPLIKERIGQHELTISYITAYYEQPLLQGIWNRWGQQTSNGHKRGWLNCSPSRNTLIRINNWKSGIPIKANGDPYREEHLQASRAYFYNSPDCRVQDRVDHKFLSYFNGNGYVTHIDPTWRLTWGDKKHLTGNDDLRGSIIIERYPVSKYEEILREKYHLYPYDPENKALQEAYAYYGETPLSLDETEIYFRACNSDQITSEMQLWQPSRDSYKRDGPPLAEFIRIFIPEWTGIK
jgi:hypothetical protein